MWRVVQRGLSLKTGVPWKSSSVLWCDESHYSPDSTDTCYDPVHFTTKTRSHCNFTKFANKQWRWHDDNDQSGGGDTGSEDPECKWKQRMRSCRHDMWSRNNPCHFLEAVGWGTAILTGIQITELCRETHKEHGCLSHRPCWVRSTVQSTVQPLQCFHFTDWLSLYVKHAAIFLSSTLNRNALQTVRYIFPASDQSVRSLSREDISTTGDRLTNERQKLDSARRVADDEIEEFIQQKFAEFASSSTSTRNKRESSLLPSVSPWSAAQSSSVSDINAAVSSLLHLARDGISSARCNAQAIAHARRGDFSRAARLWLQADGTGLANEKLLYNLAICYEHGLGIDKDLTKATELYSKAADLGHARSAYNLAIMLLQSTALNSVNQRALLMLEKAADLGLKEAQRELGVIHTEEPHRDMEKAARLFEKAALQKDAAAMYYLGICFERGWGVEQNEAEAARLYCAAATAGHTDALYNLAVFFENGLGGLPVDTTEALRLYEAASGAGNEQASERVNTLQRHLVNTKSSDVAIKLPVNDVVKMTTKSANKRQRLLSRFYQPSGSESESDNDNRDCDSFSSSSSSVLPSETSDLDTSARSSDDELFDFSLYLAAFPQKIRSKSQGTSGIRSSFSDDETERNVPSTPRESGNIDSTTTGMQEEIAGLSASCGISESFPELRGGNFGTVALPHVSSFG